jgi:hypothetical protein
LDLREARTQAVGGDLAKYNSDVNFGSGLRLLSSSFSMNSREGRGGLFDELLLNTQGLGNDPYQSSTLRLQKNKLYRYDMLWRANDYNNTALPIALGRHAINTVRLLQDHDITLLPQSNLQLFAGFSRNTQTGPALTTTNVEQHQGDEFTLFANVRRQQTQYRLGFQTKIAGIKMNVLRGWENFKEDTPFGLSIPSGANTADRNTLSSFRRAEPYHGNSPFWRLALFREKGSLWAMNGRLTYTDGRRNFISDENLLGGTRFGALNRQILVFGDARRPVATGNLTFSLFPVERVTITNHTAVTNIRMDGNATYREINSASLDLEQFSYQYLAIRSISNASDASLTATRWLTLVAGYQFTDRRIRSKEQDRFFDSDPETVAAEQTNRVHSGRFGLRIRPQKALTITLDSEVGRADRPIYPTSDRNFHILGGRVQYKRKNLMLSMYSRANYNFNSTSLTSFSSKARNYGLDGSWTASSNFTINAGYAKLHTDTLSGIAFVALQRRQTGFYSYLSNLHSLYVNANMSFRGRVDLLAGLSRVEDTADGVNRVGPLYQPGNRPFFYSAETFPLAFTSPMIRLSIRLHSKLRWNGAYQYYGYRQDFATQIIPNQGYRAHTGYTSLSWAF